MTIMESIYTGLTELPVLTPLVAGRVFPVQIPANNEIYPALTFSLEASRDIETYGGISQTKIADVTINCWAMTVLESHNLADVVRTALVGFRGAFGGHVVESVRLEYAFDVAEEAATGLHRVVVRLEIYYE